MSTYTVEDEVAGTTRQGYTLTRVYRIAGRKVRVYVERDSYEQQSRAYAQVLSAELTWTTLADNPPSRWYAATVYGLKTDAEITTALAGLADELASRAATILG